MRKPKIPSEEKLKAVDSYIKGRGSLRELGKQYGVHHSCIEKWVARYNAFGAEGLEAAATNRRYPEELKYNAVTAYNSGGRTLSDICIDYKISSISLLQRWIKKHQETE